MVPSPLCSVRASYPIIPGSTSALKGLYTPAQGLAPVAYQVPVFNNALKGLYTLA